MRLSEDIAKEQQAWATADSLEFYRSHRTRPEELYPSERLFLPELARQVRNCLDVGCAAGGFSDIMKAFNPSLSYTGVDIIPRFVELARAAHPDGEFFVSDGVHLPFEPEGFDLVFSSGVLHLNSRYQDIVRACYSMCRRYLLCDFRLTEGPSVTGEMVVNFDEHSPPTPPLPYLVVNTEALVAFLKRLTPRPASIQARGYNHAPSPEARIPLKEVTVAFFLISKGDGIQETQVDLSLSERLDA
ncbi:MAG: class I SAM-dependent methyltransferase [Dehalococcoidia bacterium]